MGNNEITYVTKIKQNVMNIIEKVKINSNSAQYTHLLD